MRECRVPADFFCPWRTHLTAGQSCVHSAYGQPLDRAAERGSGLGIGEQADHILRQARELLAQATDAAQIEWVRVNYLGRKGEVAGLIASIPSLPPAERPLAGKAFNQLKKDISALVQETADRVATGRSADPLAFDPTLPGRRRPLGHGAGGTTAPASALPDDR